MREDYLSKNSETTKEDVMYEIVHNANDTGNSKRKNGESWIEYWKHTTGKNLPTKCYCCDRLSMSFNYEFDGAHVQRVAELATPSRRLYIVPLCKDCNEGHKKESFCVPRDYLIEAREDD